MLHDQSASREQKHEDDRGEDDVDDDQRLDVHGHEGTGGVGVKIELDLTQREADDLRERVAVKDFRHLRPDSQNAIVKLIAAIDRASRG